MLVIIFFILSLDALYKDAKLSYDKGDYELANKKFERLLLKYPEDEITPDVLYWTAKLKQNPDRAIEYYNRLILSFPQSEFATLSILQLAQYEYIKGNYSSAMELYQKIIMEYPKSKCVENARKTIELMNSFWFIQIGAFSDSLNAYKAKERTAEKFVSKDSVCIFKTDKLFRVKIGVFKSNEIATQFMLENNIQGFVSRIEN